jgi:HKD family nuclease
VHPGHFRNDASLEQQLRTFLEQHVQPVNAACAKNIRDALDRKLEPEAEAIVVAFKKPPKLKLIGNKLKNLGAHQIEVCVATERERERADRTCSSIN